MTMSTSRFVSMQSRLYKHPGACHRCRAFVNWIATNNIQVVCNKVFLLINVDANWPCILIIIGYLLWYPFPQWNIMQLLCLHCTQNLYIKASEYGVLLMGTGIGRGASQMWINACGNFFCLWEHRKKFSVGKNLSWYYTGTL